MTAPIPTAVQLDSETAGLVSWYACLSGRETPDIVNGIVSGQLAHLRTELEEVSFFGRDSSEEIAEEQIEEAVERRLQEVEQ